MAGLVPAIHAFLHGPKQDVDARHKAGHDVEKVGRRASQHLEPTLQREIGRERVVERRVAADEQRVLR